MNNTKYAAIIAEYNPLHYGHCHHIAHTRNNIDADTILIIQSGAFTQRGKEGILDKYTRAKHAVLSGADIVIELPTIFALSNAEQFAKGAIRLLSSIKGDKHLSFGSECGDISLLDNIVSLILQEPQEISDNIKSYLKDSPFPQARARAYTEYARANGIQIADIEKPNNVLAVEYLKSISTLDPTILPYTLKRQGADYKSLSCDHDFLSSTAVRAKTLEGELSSITHKLPPYVYEDLSKVKVVDNSAIYLHKLQSMSIKELSSLYDITEGLENRIKKFADLSVSYKDFFANIQTKRYTTSKLQRILAYALLDITKSLHNAATSAPSYYNVLAIKSTHTPLLSTLNGYGKVYTTNQQLLTSDDPLAQLDAKAHRFQKLLTEQDAPNAMIVIN